MPNYNKVIIIGRLTKDAELRYTPKGAAIASLSVAVNRQWKNEAGEKQEEVSFVDCTAFSKTAETIGQYFRKGNSILLEGRLKQETWQDKATNANRSKLVVIVETFGFIDPAPAGGAPAAQPRAAAPAAAQTSSSEGQPESDNVPF
jgi:single-strand DNA-binding protein